MTWMIWPNDQFAKVSLSFWFLRFAHRSISWPILKHNPAAARTLWSPKPAPLKVAAELWWEVCQILTDFRENWKGNGLDKLLTTNTSTGRVQDVCSRVQLLAQYITQLFVQHVSAGLCQPLPPMPTMSCTWWPRRPSHKNSLLRPS